MLSASFAYRSRNVKDIPTFANYNVTVAGVASGGGGPASAAGTVRPTLGSFSATTAAVGRALVLRSYWANSTAGSQTYQSPTDAVFISPSTNWSVDDITNMGIVYTDVTTSSATRTINLTFNIDNVFSGGYYIITRSGTPALSLWASGAYTQGATFTDGAGGRGSNRTTSWTIPAPTDDQLIVVAYSDDTGTDNLRFVIT